MNCRLDLAGGLDLLAGLVDAVGDDGLSTIGVLDNLLRGKGARVVKLIIVGPVLAAG